MISIPRNKCGIRFHDIFFATDPSTYAHESHLAHFSQASQPLDGFAQCQTRIVDLAVDPGTLFAGLSSNTRYKIRRAERDGVVPFFNNNPSERDIAELCTHFDTFALAKRLPPSNRNKLSGLRHAGALIVTGVRGMQQELLVTHAYIADRQIARIRLLYSASHFRSSIDTEERNRIGRANRLLHWYEMCTARTNGYRYYDLGGFPMDTSDAEKNAIARFKSEFGGDTTIEYNGFTSRHRIVQHTLPTLQKIFA